jgi:signal transduction histidine kinase
MSLSAFITVVFLSGLISIIVLGVSQEAAVYQADAVCMEIQGKVNSGEANEALGITRITQLEQTNSQIMPWIDGIIKDSLLYKIDIFQMTPNKILVQLEINGVTLYSNYEEDFSEWADFYSSTESERILVDSSSNEEIGTVTVRVNPKVLVPTVLMILSMILILSIFALIVSKIVSMFLAIPVTNPIKQLEKKVKAIAEGDIETAASTELVLKRPLREIESLAASTNTIMKKLHGYNEALEQQKEVLEQQNAELEEQNDELVRSKQQIEQQQAQLVQSEKMASVGQLMAAITHEINTPIGAINSNAQLSDMLYQELLSNPKISAEEELLTLLGQLKEANDINLLACSRIIEIIKSLKTFSRLDQAEFQEMDINEGINSVLVLTNNLIKNRITVHKELGDLPMVPCYPGQLNQVFMNIIVNASQAIAGEGELFIQTLQKEDYIYIMIRDTGVGISPENMKKIFEPGFTTKGVGIGLGIGLYLCYSIIQNHKGEITVASELGQGAEFTIKLPLTQQE